MEIKFLQELYNLGNVINELFDFCANKGRTWTSQTQGINVVGAQKFTESFNIKLLQYFAGFLDYEYSEGAHKTFHYCNH